MMIAEAIHNPAEPKHWMRLKPVQRWVRILRGGEVLARTEAALRVIEVGRDVYDPVLYLPDADIQAKLRRSERQSHCPLKGRAVYFDLLAEDGRLLQPEIAWSYPQPYDFARDLAGRIAFYPDKVVVEEAPL